MNKSVKGLKASVLAQGINLILTILKTFLFTFFIAPEHFGIIALSFSFAGIIQILNDLGFSSYIIQKEEIENEELTSINAALVLLGVGAFFLTCLATIPVSSFYGQEELLWILPITGLLFIINSSTLVPLALMRKKMEFDNIGKIQVLSNFFSIVIGLVLLLFIRDYWVLLAISTSFFVFQFIFTFRFNHWEYRFSNPLNKKISAGASAFGKRLTIFNIITFISVNADKLIIAKIAGNGALGLYSKSYDFGVSNLERAVKTPISQVYFSDISGKDERAKYTLFFQYLFLMMSLLVLITGPVLVYLDWGINMLFDEDWQPLIALLPPFVLSSFIWMSMSIADVLLLAAFNTKRYLALGIAKSVIGLLAIIAASFWGVEAIAWSFFIYHLVLFVPFCRGIFYQIGLDAVRARTLLINSILVVFSAITLVLGCFLLRYFQLLGEGLSMVCFLGGYLFLHLGVWSKMEGYQDFVLLFKALISRSKLAIDGQL